MKAEYVYSRICELQNVARECRHVQDIQLELDKLAAELAAQVRTECTARDGHRSAYKVISTMLTDVRKQYNGKRPGVEYAWIDSKGRQSAIRIAVRTFGAAPHS